MENGSNRAYSFVIADKAATTLLIVGLVLLVQSTAQAQYRSPTPRPYLPQTANSTPQYIPRPLPSQVYVPGYGPTNQNIIPSYNAQPQNLTIPRPVLNPVVPNSNSPFYNANAAITQSAGSTVPVYRSQPVYSPAPQPGISYSSSPMTSTAPHATNLYRGTMGQPPSPNATSLYPTWMHFTNPPDANTVWLIQHESGWNPQVKNPNSSAFGLGQLLTSTRNYYASKLCFLNPNTTDPNLQLKMMQAYIKDRYGTSAQAKAVYQQHCATDPRGCWY